MPIFSIVNISILKKLLFRDLESVQYCSLFYFKTLEIHSASEIGRSLF